MEGKPAAYGYEELFKVHAVTVIPAIKDNSSNGRNDRGNRGYYETQGREFSEILRKEQDDLNTVSDITFHTNGYTKDARAFYTMYSSHAYSL